MSGKLYIQAILKSYHMIEICSSAGFTMTLDHLNKNSSRTIDYSQKPRVFVVSRLLSHIYSMKPCTKAISLDILNKKAIHTWVCICLCVHSDFHTLLSTVVLIFLRLIPDETN